MFHIGVFDSGIGGARFAHELRKRHPNYKVTVAHDRDHLPYGNKTPEEIQRFTEAALQSLLGSDVIILACNTATAYAIDYLRVKYPDQQFVGFEPAIKVAAGASKTKKIAVLATPATLRSQRYNSLRSKFDQQVLIFEPNVSTLAHQIETRNVDWSALEAIVSGLAHNGVDQIVLGCTHYHLISNTIAHFAGDDVSVVSPTKAVIARVDSLLK